MNPTVGAMVTAVTREATGYVQWRSDLQAAGPSGEHLESLLAGSCLATPFDSFGWLSAAAAHLPAQRSLRVLSVHREGFLRGLAALTVGFERVHGLQLRTLRLLGHPYSDRVSFPIGCADPGTAALVVRALAEHCDEFDVGILSELASPEPLATALDRSGALTGIWRICASTPVLRLDSNSIDALRGSYRKSLRTRLHRARGKLKAAGRVDFRRWRPAPEEVPGLLQRFKCVEDRSWKGRAAVGIFSPAERAAFFFDVAQRMSAREELDVATLELDSKLIAYRFGFRYRDVFYDYNLAYDPDFQHLSPGRVLLDEVVASSLADGLRAVDASRSGGTEMHLLSEWTDARVAHHELWLYGRSARARAFQLLRERVRPALTRWRALRSGAPPGESPS